jgi:oligopeptide transport system substrate-binding protein
MRHKNIFYLFLLSAVLIFLTFGCSRESDKSSFTSSNPTSSAIPESFITDLYGEPATIDPNRGAWSNQITIINQCFEGVLGFNPDLSLKPVTATDIPSVENGGISSDGLTYTFKLRHDVTWSDGAKVMARDYVYGIKRMLSPDLAADYASFYFDIIGAKEYNASIDKDESTQKQLRNSVGITALDDYTLQIKLSNQRPSFLHVMALWPAYPVREDIINKYGDQWTEPGNYIGNGPFVLSEWVHGDHITLKDNPNYWGTGKPRVSQIVFKMISDANAALAAYKNNEMYLVKVPGGTEKAVMADPVLSKEILRYPKLYTIGVEFNVTKAPFDNVKVRQAFATAIDRVSFINKVHAGVGIPAYSWIPPGMAGHDAGLGQEYKFDPTKAKKLLTEAGYADVNKLPPIKFTYFNIESFPMDAQFIQGQLKANLGIEITLDPMETKAATVAFNSGNYQVGLLGWVADYPDPDDWLPPNFKTGAGTNFTKYSNPQFDELCERASKELNYTKRMELWAKAHEMIVRDVPIACIYNVENLWLLKPYVKGLTTMGMDGMTPGDFFYRDIYIDK